MTSFVAVSNGRIRPADTAPAKKSTAKTATKKKHAFVASSEPDYQPEPETEVSSEEPVEAKTVADPISETSQKYDDTPLLPLLRQARSSTSQATLLNDGSDQGAPYRSCLARRAIGHPDYPCSAASVVGPRSLRLGSVVHPSGDQRRRQKTKEAPLIGGFFLPL